MTSKLITGVEPRSCGKPRLAWSTEIKGELKTRPLAGNQIQSFAGD